MLRQLSTLSASTTQRMLPAVLSGSRGAHDSGGRGPAGGYHFTDYEAPDFDQYRRDSVKGPHTSSQDSDAQRKLFSYSMYGMALGVSVLYAKEIVRGVVGLKWPPPYVLAANTTKVDISGIPEGTTKMFTRRGAPVFVKHRTAQEITREEAVPMSLLRHRQSDSERYRGKPQWMIVVGVCTHLGCIPVADKGAYGGWYCPCHGSHYDASGRIRKGPAPDNLEVPPYDFVDEETVVIGA